MKIDTTAACHAQEAAGVTPSAHLLFMNRCLPGCLGMSGNWAAIPAVQQAAGLCDQCLEFVKHQQAYAWLVWHLG